ncbi:MAG: hypothetical protein CM15mP59_0520 [Flavobacteriaceae bacterium]|nr:MAG: hypothetical protein CM15mP59_0520 [Flavobacteriaceae bacterium]
MVMLWQDQVIDDLGSSVWDFSNGAQIMIDQYLSSAEDKWKLQNGLVLLLLMGMRARGRAFFCSIWSAIYSFVQKKYVCCDVTHQPIYFTCCEDKVKPISESH